jgi:hypothetical protein
MENADKAHAAEKPSVDLLKDLLKTYLDIYKHHFDSFVKAGAEKKTRQPELRKFLSNPARTGSCYTKPEAAAMQSRNPLSSGWSVFPTIAKAASDSPGWRPPADEARGFLRA